MSLDLYKIYRMYSQRCRRDSDVELSRKIKGSMEKLIYGRLEKDEMIKVVYEIKELEAYLNPRLKRYAPEIFDAIINETYSINIPYALLHKRREQENNGGFGHIYLGISDQKFGQVKIGATTLKISKREYAYRRKWGYSMSIDWFQTIQHPFSFESELKEFFNDDLVAGVTSGDSNEWYYGDIEEMADSIQSLLDARDLD